jgi:hypothetical protein
MTRPMSRELRYETADREASRIYRELEAWRDAHPDATYDEIEQEVRRRRPELMSTFIALLINGRTTGMQPEAPHCPECGSEMSFEGYRPWRVRGLEGETALERAYYRCLKCKRQGFFPPGRAVGPAGRPSE